LGAPGLAALLVAYMLPVCALLAPCHPGAALRDLCNESLLRDTSAAPKVASIAIDWNGVNKRAGHRWAAWDSCRPGENKTAAPFRARPLKPPTS